MASLTDGIGIYNGTIPSNLPRGIVKPTEYPGMTAEIRLADGAEISAHACEHCVSLHVRNVLHYEIGIHGSFEQLHYLLSTWIEQLCLLEAEAREADRVSLPVLADGN